MVQQKCSFATAIKRIPEERHPRVTRMYADLVHHAGADLRLPQPPAFFLAKRREPRPGVVPLAAHCTVRGLGDDHPPPALGVVPDGGGDHAAKPILAKWEKKGQVKNVGTFKTLQVYKKK